MSTEEKESNTVNKNTTNTTSKARTTYRDRVADFQNKTSGVVSASTPDPVPAPTPKTKAFNEAAYLAANPDVANAIKNGTTSVKSGYAHYIKWGKDAGRSLGV